MSSKLTNYSAKNISTKAKNFVFLNDNASTSDKSFRLYLRFDISMSILHQQAEDFSLNYKTHGYINFFKTLCCKVEEVQQNLYNLYIYSFVKCFVNGLNFSKISEQADLGLAMIGHSQMFDIMKSPFCQQLEGDFLLSYMINLPTVAEKEAILVRLLSSFPFLGEFRLYSIDAFGTSAFFIPQYETFLQRLFEDYYSKDHFKNTTGSTDKMDSKDLKSQDQEEKEKSGKKRNKNNSNEDKIYPNGRLILVKLNKGQTNSVTGFKQSPIMNGFYSIDKKHFIFSEVGNGISMEFNHSLFFSKGIQLRVDGSNLNDLVKIDRYYLQNPLTLQQRHLICSEVSAMTGIKPRFVGSSQKFKTPFKVPPISKIIDVLDKIKQNGKDYRALIDWLLEETEIEDFAKKAIEWSEAKSES